MKAKVKKFNPPRAALRYAQELRDKGATWEQAHNQLFGRGGRITQLFPSEQERAEFLKTPEADQVYAILGELPRPAPQESASGKILVRVPKSVHAALLTESEQEGTSLNQLIVAKLSVGLSAASR